MAAYINPVRLTARLLRAAGDRIAQHDKKDLRLCVINYHRILPAPDPLLASEPDVQAFRWQMELLAECFNVLPLQEALAALEAGELPPRAVCITFDDGYRSVHDLALPILMELDLHATVFVTSGYLGNGNMWNDRIIEAVQNLPAGALDLRHLNLGIYPLMSLADRRRAAEELIAASKYLPPERRGAVAQELEDMLGYRLSDEAMLTPEMVRNLALQGLEIGGHTVSHPILAGLDDDAARYEIAEGKRQLEAIIGRPVSLFAYPNGKFGIDFDERHMRMAKEAGFSAAFTTSIGAASRKNDLFRLPRSRPWDTAPSLFGLRLLRWLTEQRP